jgi:hypothetical protein
MRANGLRYRNLVCIPQGKRTKINYKITITQYIDLVNRIFLYIVFSQIEKPYFKNFLP